MKKIQIHQSDLPKLSLRRQQKKLWKSTTTVVTLIFFENDRTLDISQILLDILDAFDDGSCGYLVRYISVTRSIIESLEKKLTTASLESYRYPIRIGVGPFECLLTVSNDVLSLRPLIEHWRSADDFDLFLLPEHRLGLAADLFKSDGYKNLSSIYYDVISLSNVVFSKYCDEEILEIYSQKFTYEDIKQRVSKVVHKLGIDFHEA